MLAGTGGQLFVTFERYSFFSSRWEAITYLNFATCVNLFPSVVKTSYSFW